MPEIPPLYTEMTVEEYLQFAAELKKIPKDQRDAQIEKVVQMAKLEDVKNRLIQNLSKGYRQRVGLAQAILGFPEIIILDEPTVGLDPKQIIEIRELIRNLAKQHTVILSSHILAEVREVCDYILIIANGKLVASDTPENLEENIGSRGYIEVQSYASEDEMRLVLEDVGMIQSVEYSVESQGDKQVTTAQIKTKENVDIREEIFCAFAKRQMPLLTLMLMKNTLEDVFLELTQGNAVQMMESEVSEDDSDL